MKLGIGTSQFIKNYGFFKNKANKKDLIQIIKKFSNKIDLVDTAPSYSLAEKCIGIYRNDKIKIVTKISKISSKNILNKRIKINKSLKESLNKLKKKKIYGILFHHIEDLNITKKQITKLNLDYIKKNFAKKIGFSCYDIDDIEKYLKLYNFDIVQFPLNVFDINKKKIEFLKKIKKKYNLELHARSIFLQGIIFKKNLNSQKKFKIINKKMEDLRRISSKYKLSKYDFCLSSINSLKVIDYAIIGLSNLNEYENLKNLRRKKIKFEDLFRLEIKNKKILDPRKW